VTPTRLERCNVTPSNIDALDCSRTRNRRRRRLPPECANCIKHAATSTMSGLIQQRACATNSQRNGGAPLPQPTQAVAA
jgi:hypothetical protein